MNIDQERRAFEKEHEGMSLGRDPHDPESYRNIAIQDRWEAWQARAALQSQDREDAARLDWLQQSDGRFFKLLHITSIVGRGFSPTNSSDKWFSSLREAIDHARRVEGD